MNRQTSIFEPTPIENAEILIINALKELIAENGLSGMNAKFEELKEKGTAKNYSITFLGNVIVRIYCGKKVTYLEFPKEGKFDDGTSNAFVKKYINSVEDVPNHIDEIKTSCQYILDGLPKDFSCCSRYKECSDKKICIHPGKPFAAGCFYRKVIHSGRVFYGDNRNVD